MAFLKSASLPSVASLSGTNLQFLGCGSQKTTTTDDSSLKVANGGDEDGMLFVVYSHTGRPVAMGMWAAGNESPPRSASSIANYGYTFDVGDGGYGDAAPGGTFGTDGNITLWNAYPQGSYIVNRCGGTLYHSVMQLRGSGS